MRRHPGGRLLATGLLSLASADKQGYTPYGYGVDTPVLVRSTVSYGRGWQMLRSRGEGSTAAGPCDPPQDASSCNCSFASTAPPVDDEMPACIATSLCNQPVPPPAGALPPRTTILLVLDANATNQRFYFGKRDVYRAYNAQVNLMARLLVSLKAVQTQLPVSILVTGVHFPAAERKLADLGATVLPCAAQRPRPRSTAAMEKQGRAHGRPSPASFLAGFVGPFTIGSRTSSPSRSSRTALRRARRAPTPARARAPPHSARPTLARWRGRGGRPDGHIAVRAMWW